MANWPIRLCALLLLGYNKFLHTQEIDISLTVYDFGHFESTKAVLLTIAKSKK